MLRKSAYEMILQRAHEVVKAAGLFEEFEHSERFLLCILNEPYMPLVVGSWPTPDALLGERRRVLIAHYYRHANRTYPDPALEMTDVGFPIRLLQTVFGVMETRVLFRDPETQQVMVSAAAKRDMAELLRIWARNIKEQGFIDAAKRMAANGGQVAIPSWIEQQMPTKEPSDALADMTETDQRPRPHFTKGDRFRLSQAALENYGTELNGIYTVEQWYDHYRSKEWANDPHGSPLFDEAGCSGCCLYRSTFDGLLYEWEMVRVTEGRTRSHEEKQRKVSQLFLFAEDR